MALNQAFVFLLQTFSAGILVLGTLYSAYAISFKLFNKESIPLHWCSTVAIGLWTSAFGFNLLIGFGRFNIQTALLSVIIYIMFSYIWTRVSLSLFIRLLNKDLRWLRMLLRLRRITPTKICTTLFFMCSILITLRMLLLVPLGWDFITYHGLKAATWVQQGEYPLMHAPNGWSCYRNFFGGGEVFTAWAMLPFHGDLLVCFVDVTQWLFLGLGVLTLGREVGVRGKYSLIPVFYVLFIPALWLSVGSGYVELGLNLSLLYGGLFLLKYFRSKKSPYLCLSGMAFGVAASVKLTVFPILVLFVVISFAYIIFHDNKPRSFTVWLCSIFAASLAVAPWFIRNIIDLGYPLDMPLTIGGIKLGQINTLMEWYQQRPDLQPYRFPEEFKALSTIFPMPYRIYPHLGMFTLLPMIASIFGLSLLYKRDKFITFFFTGVFLSVMLLFYSPDFSVARIVYAPGVSRFLLPMIIPAVIIGSSFFSMRLKCKHVYYSLMIVGILLHAFFSVFYGWARWEYPAVAVLFLCIVTGIFFFRRLHHTGKLLLFVFVLYPVLLLFSLQIYKNKIRYKAIAECTILHCIPNYWYPAAEIVDTDTSLNIAVTGAILQNGDNWFIYYFLGKRLQNNIFYIPMSATFDKHFQLMDPQDLPGTYNEWISNLSKNNIDHIIDFGGHSKEMSWITQHPELFERVYPKTEHAGAWGLYKYKGEKQHQATQPLF